MLSQLEPGDEDDRSHSFESVISLKPPWETSVNTAD